MTYTNERTTHSRSFPAAKNDNDVGIALLADYWSAWTDVDRDATNLRYTVERAGVVVIYDGRREIARWHRNSWMRNEDK